MNIFSEILLRFEKHNFTDFSNLFSNYNFTITESSIIELHIQEFNEYIFDNTLRIVYLTFNSHLNYFFNSIDVQIYNISFYNNFINFIADKKNYIEYFPSGNYKNSNIEIVSFYNKINDVNFQLIKNSESNCFNIFISYSKIDNSTL